jgi:hypothetical protein
MAYEKAAELSEVVGSQLMELRYRIDRLVHGYLSAVDFRFYYDNETLRYAQALEDGDSAIEDGSPEARFYLQLAQGQLEDAAATLKSIEEKDNFALLLAASMGADPSLAADFIKKGKVDLENGQNIACALGIYARAGKEGEILPEFNELAGLERSNKIPSEIIKLLRNGQFEAAEKKMRTLKEVYLEFELKKMACVMLGEKAPMPWRQEVKRFYFVYERPWIVVDANSPMSVQ